MVGEFGFYWCVCITGVVCCLPKMSGTLQGRVGSAKVGETLWESLGSAGLSRTLELRVGLPKVSGTL